MTKFLRCVRARRGAARAASVAICLSRCVRPICGRAACAVRRRPAWRWRRRACAAHKLPGSFGQGFCGMRNIYIHGRARAPRRTGATAGLERSFIEHIAKGSALCNGHNGHNGDTIQGHYGFTAPAENCTKQDQEAPPEGTSVRRKPKSLAHQLTRTRFAALSIEGAEAARQAGDRAGWRIRMAQRRHTIAVCTRCQTALSRLV